MFARRLLPLLIVFGLTACERLGDALDLPDPKKAAAEAEAEGKAIGGACRQTGRPVEDCYALNAKAPKAAVFAGWREMNDYMMQHNLQATPSQMANPASPQPGGATGAAAPEQAATPATAAAPTRDERAARRPRTGP